MHDPAIHRRDLLAMLPAAIAVPAAFAQSAAPGAQDPARAPAVRPRNVPGKGGADGLTMPFAVAACWADDLGALSAVRMRARLDSTIGFRSAREPAGDDDSCVILMSMGAAIECAACLASASMAGTAIFYAPSKDSGDLVQFSVRLGQVRRMPPREAVHSAIGIFSRPDPRGAFDPAGVVEPACLEKVRVSMIDQGFTAVVIEPDKRAKFLDALFDLAKGSPVIAAAVGTRESWEVGCTPVMMGRGPAGSLQGAIIAGRGIQRAGLFAHQYGVSVDARVLPPGALEAAEAGSSERAAAATALATLMPGEGFQPLAIVRVGRLASPRPRAAPDALSMLEPSCEAPGAAPADGAAPVAPAPA